MTRKEKLRVVERNLKEDKFNLRMDTIAIICVAVIGIAYIVGTFLILTTVV